VTTKPVGVGLLGLGTVGSAVGRAFADLIPELERLGLFVREGEVSTPATPFSQTVNEYVASFHARSSLARHRLGDAAAGAFDRDLRALLGDRTTVERQVSSRIVHGRPVA
jgi:hypothetical protein